jgi:hypothetical protein
MEMQHNMGGMHQNMMGMQNGMMGMHQSMWIYYGLLIVVGLIALDILVGIIMAIVRKSFSLSKLASFLKSDILKNVFPLTLLAQFIYLDPTHLVLRIMFYIAAIGLVIKYVRAIIKKFSG